MEDTNEILGELAVQFWKLCAAFEHAVAGADDAAGQSNAAQLRYARGRLNSLLARGGMELRTFDGQPWDASLPPSALNAETVSSTAAVVERTIEPTILSGSTVVMPGKIMLKEA